MLEKVGKTEKTTDGNYTEFVVNFNKQQVSRVILPANYITVLYMYMYTSSAFLLMCLIMPTLLSVLLGNNPVKPVIVDTLKEGHLYNKDSPIAI